MEVEEGVLVVDSCSVVEVVVVVGSGSEVVVVVVGSGSAPQVLVDAASRHSTAVKRALLILMMASLGSLRLDHQSATAAQTSFDFQTHTR